ncbi:hypothetical protein [Kitasatospora sp. NPDC058046]
MAIDGHGDAHISEQDARDELETNVEDAVRTVLGVPPRAPLIITIIDD